MNAIARSAGPASLATALALAVLAAACSGSSEASVPESTPPASTSTSPTDPPAENPPPAKTSATPPLRAGVDPDVAATLTKAGIDVANLPDDLDEVLTSRAKTQAVMTSFTQALGVSCDGCHAKSGSRIDYEAATPQKKVAERMWKDFVRALKQADGSALYCDSCHQGKMKFLDRADEGALTTWMGENFVAKLARRDGAKHACATCHGSPFDGEFLDTWSK